MRREKNFLTRIEVRKISFVSKFFSVRNSETNIFSVQEKRREKKKGILMGREEKKRRE